ncbi:hypothetical protein RI054_30g121520 [Pseudoscourfieldia marina]
MPPKRAATASAGDEKAAKRLSVDGGADATPKEMAQGGGDADAPAATATPPKASPTPNQALETPARDKGKAVAANPSGGDGGDASAATTTMATKAAQPATATTVKNATTVTSPASARVGTKLLAAILPRDVDEDALSCRAVTTRTSQAPKHVLNIRAIAASGERVTMALWSPANGAAAQLGQRLHEIWIKSPERFLVIVIPCVLDPASGKASYEARTGGTSYPDWEADFTLVFNKTASDTILEMPNISDDALRAKQFGTPSEWAARYAATAARRLAISEDVL